MKKQENSESITVKVTQESGKKMIEMSYHFSYVTTEDGDHAAVYIPAYDIHFSAPKNADVIRKRATNIVTSFYKHWTQREGLKQFFLRLHLLGFRMSDNHNYALKKLLNSDVFNTKFESKPVLPEMFQGATSLVSEGVFEAASA